MKKVFRKLTTKGNNGTLSINGIIREYEVSAGASVSAGDFVEFVNKFGNGEFNPVTSKCISACKLDNSRVLVAYADGGNSSYGTAVVLSITDGAVTVGTETVFKSTNTNSYLSACTLTENKVLVAFSYIYETQTHWGAMCLTIDGTIINVGAEYTIADTNSSYMSTPLKLDNSRVLVAYKKASGGSVAEVLTINDTEINRGSYSTIYDGSIYTYFSACTLTENKVLVAFSGVAKKGYAVVLTIDGTTISVGKAAMFVAGDANCVSAVALTDSKVLVAYNRDGGIYGGAVILSVDNTVITVGEEEAFDLYLAMYVSAVALTDSKVLVAYDDKNAGSVLLLNIDGTTIINVTKLTFYSNPVTYISALAFSSHSLLVAFNGGGVGVYKSLTIDGDTITVDQTTSNGTKVQKATSNLHNVGVAKTSGKEGEKVQVYCVPKQITFAIDGTTYQAEEGMTWLRWINSEYNTDGFGRGAWTGLVESPNGDYVYDEATSTFAGLEEKGGNTGGTDVNLNIIANNAYITKVLVHNGGSN